MYYEVYIDSLLLISFAMNYYVLLLTNYVTYKKVKVITVILGAAVGAAISCIFVFDFIPFWLKILLGGVVGPGVMIGIAFQTRSLKRIFKLMERVLLFSFLMGGSMFFLFRRFWVLAHISQYIWGIMAVGAIICTLVLRHIIKKNEKERNSVVSVILRQENQRVKLSALIDTGNSLMEPISGKPVCVIDREVYWELYGKEKRPFRVVPYHSIGKGKGYMEAYVLEQLVVELPDENLHFREIFIAVGEELIGGEIKMILNPRLLQK